MKDKSVLHLSLEQKIGQMFLLAFAGNEIKGVSTLIRDYYLGGCYISQENAATPEDACALSKKLQDLALNSCGIPLLLGADQEGAWGVLVPYSITGPGNLGLGAVNTIEDTERLYTIIGSEMTAVGYNTVLAPCADVNIDPKNPIIGMRSFGENPKRVADHVRAGIRGLHKAGAITTAKHFPGHGNTGTDSHRTFPVVKGGKTELLNSDLLPFRAAIDEGVDIIMTSHILYPAFDNTFPATLSREILQNLLRKELMFSGVILSDSMNMGAIKKYRDPVESAVMAIHGGVDMIMLAEEHYDHDQQRYLENQKSIIAGVIEAVKRGEIREEQIDRSVSRILDLKKTYLSDVTEEMKHLNAAMVGRKENREAEKEISLKTVTILKNGRSLWPVREGDRLAVINTVPNEAYAILTETRGIGPNQPVSAFTIFKESLESVRENVHFYSYEEVRPDVSLPDELKSADKIALITEDYPIPGLDFDVVSQHKIVDRIISAFPDRVIIIGLRTPYELSRYPGATTYICTFSSRPSAAEAAALAVAGKIDAEGESPVTIP